MTKLHELTGLGQSIWYDNIRRALIDNGELQALMDSGVTGVTSNPSIFEKAIAGSTDDDKAIRKLATEDLSAETIYETLALEDLRRIEKRPGHGRCPSFGKCRPRCDSLPPGQRCCRRSQRPERGGAMIPAKVFFNSSDMTDKGNAYE